MVQTALSRVRVAVDALFHQRAGAISPTGDGTDADGNARPTASRRVSLSQDQAEYVEAAGAVITCVALRTVESIVVRTPAYPCG
jgi:hypothetical protein